MSCCGSQSSICPCGAFVHPAIIANAAGLDAIVYRVGDYTSFREALLRALPGEVSLTATQTASDGETMVVQLWRPGATGDLAVQMVEWWAYLADILTFYNQYIANQSYVRTASQSITVNRLVRLLGYRPKPGIGAVGTLAALMSGTAAFTLPKGFQIQSKPGPGQPPQIFEVSADTAINSPVSIPVEPQPLPGINITAGNSADTENATVLVDGVVSLQKGVRLLLVQNGWPKASSNNYAVGTVTSISTAKTPGGKPYAQISLALITSTFLIGPYEASGYQLLKSATSTRFNQFAKSSGNTLNLPSIIRQINAGNLVLVEDPIARFMELAGVQSATETIVDLPGSSPPDVMPFPYTQLQVTPPPTLWDAGRTIIWYNWQPTGVLIDQPAAGVTLAASTLPFQQWKSGQNGTTTLDLSVRAPAGIPSGSLPTNFLLDDANGNGVEVGFGLPAPSSNCATLTVTPPNVPPATLATPLDLLFDLLPVTCGKTVANEVLGTGNAAIAGQDFVLQKSPVTYLTDPASISGGEYSSTVQVWVNSLKWSEVQSFYNQPKTAQIFVTREDEQGQTHVTFGDGVNGARPPTGASIVATYRYGSGASVPAVGSLTGILKPLPGLRAIRNPVQVGGGADPAPRDQVRKYAPKSVLNFGRAISVDDFEELAGTAPGVTQVQAIFGLNPKSQRPQMLIYVLPGTKAAVQSVQTILTGSADPNRLPAVQGARQISIKIHARLLIAPNTLPAVVLAAATNALAGQSGSLLPLDPSSDTPGTCVFGIGQALYDSQIYAALQVPGVTAVEGYSFRFQDGSSGKWPCCGRQRHDPQPGNYFALALPGDLCLSTVPPVASP